MSEVSPLEAKKKQDDKNLAELQHKLNGRTFSEIRDTTEYQQFLADWHQNFGQTIQINGLKNSDLFKFEDLSKDTQRLLSDKSLHLTSGINDWMITMVETRGQDETALYTFCAHAECSMLFRLLRHGASVDTKINIKTFSPFYSATALMVATNANNLLYFHPSFGAKVRCSRFEKLAAIPLLLVFNASLFVKNIKDFTALDITLYQGLAHSYKLREIDFNTWEVIRPLLAAYFAEFKKQKPSQKLDDLAFLTEFAPKIKALSHADQKQVLVLMENAYSEMQVEFQDAKEYVAKRKKNLADSNQATMPTAKDLYFFSVDLYFRSIYENKASHDNQQSAGSGSNLAPRVSSVESASTSATTVTSSASSINSASSQGAPILVQQQGQQQLQQETFQGSTATAQTATNSSANPNSLRS